MQLCKKSLVLTGAIWPETITPTLLQGLPAHSNAAPQCFTILGVLLMFCSQISQPAHKVHYSWSGEDLWLQTHQPSPAQEPGSPRKRCFGGKRRGGHLRGPQETLSDAPRGHITQAGGQRLFSPFPRFSTPSHSRRDGPARPPREGQPPPCLRVPGPRRG